MLERKNCLSKAFQLTSRWLAFLVVCLLSVPATAQTIVQGAIAVDTQWQPESGPYVLRGDVVVQSGATLRIAAGTQLFMDSGSGLRVQAGSVRAQGTADSPIQVRSERSRAGLAAQPGDWGQWHFTAGTVNTLLEHMVFSHGRGIVIHGSSPVLNYVSVENQAGAAISIDLEASPSGIGNTATGNTLNGIAVPSGDVTGSVSWGLRGIPYVIGHGYVSVGVSPIITSISPSEIQQGETAIYTFRGSRLAGLDSLISDYPGLTAVPLPGGSDVEARFEVTASPDAALGETSFEALTDAGPANRAAPWRVAPAQPTLTSLTPAKLFTGQGAVELTVSGRGFQSTSQVQINGADVTTRFVSGSEVVATVPAPASPSVLDVTMITPAAGVGNEPLISNSLDLPVEAARIVLSPSSATVPRGFSRNFNAKLPYAAPAGGVTITLVSSVPSVATTPTSVLVPAGQTEIEVPVSSSGLGVTTLTASRNGFISGQSTVTVVVPPTLTLTPGSLAIGQGRVSVLALQSSVPAGDGGLTVAIASSDSTVVSVPESVTIPAGSQQAVVELSTLAIGEATITAQATEYVGGISTVSVRPASVLLPEGVLVAPGLVRSLPLTLSDPAPAGGVEVSLQSSDPSVIGVPASVSVAEGQTVANFELTGISVGSATITATASGYQAGSTPVVVETVTIGVGSPVLTSISVPAELTHSYALTLSKPAPKGGVLVALSVADTSVATVSPSSIVIAEGETTGNAVQLRVTGASKGSTVLTASAPGLATASIPLSVTGKLVLRVLNANNQTAAVAGKGMRSYVNEVRVDAKTDGANYRPAQQGGLSVSLVSSDPGKLLVPDKVVIPANREYEYFTMTGLELTGSTPVTVDAIALGVTSPATKLSVSIVAPNVVFEALDGNRATASARDNFRLYVRVPGAVYDGNETVSEDMAFQLSTAEANPVSIVDDFYAALTGGAPIGQVVIPAGGNRSAYVYVGTPSSAGSYKIRANAVGYVNALSAIQTVSSAELRIRNNNNQVTAVAGKGMNSYYAEVYVQRIVNGQAFNGASPLVVNLTSSDPGKLVVPSTVTIPANADFAYFTLTGVDFTEGTPVTVDAYADGVASPATKMTVNVVAPTVTFESLDGNRSAGGARDNFRLYVRVPGSVYSGNETVASATPFQLSLADATPSNVVDGFYTALTGGTPIEQVVIASGNNRSGYVHVGSPAVSGTYKVRASVAGMSEATSVVQTVSAPALRIRNANGQFSVLVGKGMRNYLYEMQLDLIANGQPASASEPLVVNLTSSDPSKVSVPATVTIPANASSVNFYVTGIDVTNGGPVVVDAFAEGVSSPSTKLSVTVIAPTLAIEALDGERAPASARDNFRLFVRVPGAYYPNNAEVATDMPFQLSLVDRVPGNVVDGFYAALTGGSSISQVLIPAGSNRSAYLHVGSPAVPGTYQVRATAAGITETISTLQTVSSPGLRIRHVANRASLALGTGMNSYINEIYIERIVGGQPFNGAESVVVSLACSAQAVCVAPATVTIPANASSQYFQVTGVNPGSAVIGATATGYLPSPDMPVTTSVAELGFSSLASSSAVGQNNGFTVYPRVSAAYYANNVSSASSLLVNLTSSTPGVATVPLSVTVAPGAQRSGTANLVGVTPGTTTVTASSEKTQSVTSPTITIVP